MVAKTHNRFMATSEAYRNWHQHKASDFIHFSILTLFLIALSFALVTSQNATATSSESSALYPNGDPTYKFVLGADKTTATVGGADVVTLTGKIFKVKADSMTPTASIENPVPSCSFASNPAGEGAEKVVFEVSGTGNTYNSANLSINCSTGAVSTTLTSTVAATKNAKLWMVSKGGNLDTGLNIDIVFSEPAPVPQPEANNTTTQTNNSTTQSQTQTATKTTESTADATKITSPQAISINGQELENKETLSSFQKNESVVISGIATPSSKVTLYIFSEPRVAEVIADIAGKWSYEIKDLEPGSHRVEAVMTDAAGLVSERVELAKFAIVDAKPVEVTAYAETKKSFFEKNKLYIIAGGLTLVIGAGALAYVLVQRRKAKIKS